MDAVAMQGLLAQLLEQEQEPRAHGKCPVTEVRRYKPIDGNGRSIAKEEGLIIVTDDGSEFAVTIRRIEKLL